MTLSEFNRNALPKPGHMIGEYELAEVIGTGGFGAVYRALQPRLNREVAIKVILPSVAQNVDEVSARFVREIDLVSRLEHPNIVRLYDFGKTPTGLLWMSMELVRGTSLEAQRVITPARARHITMQILDGLIEAHGQHILHRDLKPANIMLCRKGAEDDFVKLLDFGISKAFGPAANTQNNDLTDPNTTSYGTPRYMAPEQIYNSEVGPHSDVYAVGLILYEMLFGRAAISGDNPLETLAHQVTQAIDIPAELAASPFGQVLARAVMKDWEERYPTARAFFQDLKAIPESQLPEVTRDARGVAVAFDTGQLGASGAGDFDLTEPLARKSAWARVDTQANAVLAPAAGSRWASMAAVILVLVVVGIGAAWWLNRADIAQAPAGSASAPDTAPQGPPATPTQGVGKAGVAAVERAAAPATPPPPPETAPTDALSGDGQQGLKPGESPTEQVAPSPPLALVFTSNPPGASVFLGEAELGTTPLQVEIARARLAGTSMTYELRKSGYKPYLYVQGETDHLEVTVDAQLTRARRARRRTPAQEPAAAESPLDIKLER